MIPDTSLMFFEYHHQTVVASREVPGACKSPYDGRFITYRLRGVA